ncbi:13947_t:CDS:2, partial [Acaulospora colombiana]
ESYLQIEKIILAAYRTGAHAIHPGYGFLSENAEFARQVAEAGKRYSTYDLIFIVIPGYNGDDQSLEVIVQEAKKIGFPILLKASAGGGGKGMRVVYEESKLLEEIELAKSESLRSFGSDRLLIEKYFDSIRHVEVQILGDQYGNVYHCFERDCSVQRRYQKVIEETPSPFLEQDLRDRMFEVAVQIGKFLKYSGAGTVEFIVMGNRGSSSLQMDPGTLGSEKFLFMNTEVPNNTSSPEGIS